MALVSVAVLACWLVLSQRDAPAAPAAADACRPTRGDVVLGDALLHVPPRARAPLPLVIAFHGARGDGPGFARESGLSKAADRHGFAVLYPTAGSSRRFWAPTEPPDDVARLRALLPQAEQRACADPARVYATGVSNGGGFAARVGCAMADTIAAVAPVAGGYRSLDPCSAGARTSMLEIHGSADQVVPYQGRGTDHGWPGARPPWPRHHPSRVEARELVWRFFAGKRLAR